MMAETKYVMVIYEMCLQLLQRGNVLWGQGQFVLHPLSYFYVEDVCTFGIFGIAIEADEYFIEDQKNWEKLRILALWQFMDLALIIVKFDV